MTPMTDRMAHVAGDVLRRARSAAGMTQRELSVASGVGQPTIAAYESGARQPSVPALWRLLEATGCSPSIATEREADQPGSDRSPATSERTSGRDSDGRSRNDRYVDALCDRYAEFVRHDPDLLISEAREALGRLADSHYQNAWRSILEAGPAAVIAVLTSRDPEARGLKSDAPFAFLRRLDDRERSVLLESVR